MGTRPQINLEPNSDISKINNNRTIRVCGTNNSAEINLNENNKEATLKYYYGGKLENLFLTRILQIEEENNELKIYRSLERAKWLTAVDIEKLLGEDLYKTFIIDSPGFSDEQIIKFIISKQEPLIAVVNQDKRFMKMIDRSKLIEKATRSLT